MRIGLFTDTYPPFINGVSTSIRMLEDELRKKGHTVYIVTVNSESMKYMSESQMTLDIMSYFFINLNFLYIGVTFMSTSLLYMML